MLLYDLVILISTSELGFLEEAEHASFQEVVMACCFHSLRTGRIWRIVLLAGCLYFFLFGLALLGGDSAQVLAGCRAGELFITTVVLCRPVASILATVLMQSSSTTTSVIVSLVEAKVLDEITLSISS
jgi:sodium-dependent phosphate cotransporter